MFFGPALSKKTLISLSFSTTSIALAWSDKAWEIIMKLGRIIVLLIERTPENTKDTVFGRRTFMPPPTVLEDVLVEDRPRVSP